MTLSFQEIEYIMSRDTVSDERNTQADNLNAQLIQRRTNADIQRSADEFTSSRFGGSDPIDSGRGF